MEQDKSKDIAEDYQDKILHEIFEDPLQEDECLKTIVNNTDLKSKIDKILEGIDSDEQGGVESSIKQLLTSLIEEMQSASPSQSKYLSQYKAKLSNKISALKILLLLKGSKKGKFSEPELSAEEKNIQRQQKQHVKNLLKRFVIYEIYKIMNPKRIAGETKTSNFTNNMITGGLKRALKYEGGKPKDLAKYSPGMIKKLTKYHNKFKTNSKGLQI